MALSFLYGNALEEGDPGSWVFDPGWPCLSTSVVWFQVSYPVPFEPLYFWKMIPLPLNQSPGPQHLSFQQVSLRVSPALHEHTPPDPANHLILQTIRWGLRLSLLALSPWSVWSLPLSACFSSELSWHSPWQVGENACDKWLCAFQDSFDPWGMVDGGGNLPEKWRWWCLSSEHSPSCSGKPGRAVASPECFLPYFVKCCLLLQ